MIGRLSSRTLQEISRLVIPTRNMSFPKMLAKGKLELSSSCSFSCLWVVDPSPGRVVWKACAHRQSPSLQRRCSWCTALDRVWSPCRLPSVPRRLACPALPGQHIEITHPFTDDAIGVRLSVEFGALVVTISATTGSLSGTPRSCSLCLFGR